MNNESESIIEVQIIITLSICLFHVLTVQSITELKKDRRRFLKEAI